LESRTATAVRKPVGLPADAYKNHIDMDRTILDDSVIPLDAYELQKVVDLGRAKYHLEKESEKRRFDIENSDRSEEEKDKLLAALEKRLTRISPAYKKNKVLVTELTDRLSDLERELEMADEHKADPKVIDMMKREYYYMKAFDHESEVLCRELNAHEQTYNKKLAEEKLRYTSKIGKLSEDKNRELRANMEGKSKLRKSWERVMRGLPVVLTYVLAKTMVPVAMIGEELSVIVSATVGGMSMIPADYLLNRMETAKIAQITKDYEPEFRKADREHRAVVVDIEEKYTLRKAAAYNRAKENILRSRARFYPDSIKIVLSSAEKTRDELEDIAASMPSKSLKVNGFKPRAA
jgi:hypothetical protein